MMCYDDDDVRPSGACVRSVVRGSVREELSASANNAQCRVLVLGTMTKNG